MLLSILVLSALSVIHVHAAHVIDRLSHVSLHRNGKAFGVGVIVGFEFVAAPWSIIENIPNNELKIIMYTYGTDQPPVTYSVRSKRPHFNYAVKSDSNNFSRPVHNIGLIRVNEMFDMSDRSFIGNADLPEQGYQTPPGSVVTLGGYDAAETPETGNGYVVDPKECQEVYGKLYDGELCFSGLDPEDPEESPTFCRGDEGTAVFLNKTGDKLVGIASRIAGCDNASYPVVLTDIGYHRNWIDRSMTLIRDGAPHQNDSWWTKFWSGRNGPSENCQVGYHGKTVHEWDCNTGCEESKSGYGGCTNNYCCCYNGTKATSYYDIIYGANEGGCTDVYQG